VEAVHWYRLAAEAGHPAAMMSLARLYEGCDGVPADRGAAFALYNKALAAGHAEAARELERLGEPAGAGRVEYAGEA
jgi:TPR repeat protein